MTPDAHGLLLCSRYAFAPNYYHYCGPDKQQDLKEYVETRTSDRGLTEILHGFDTLYQYLVLIAGENKLHDPFDRRVVEAYWLGNTLLRCVTTKAFTQHVIDGLALNKKLPANAFRSTMDRMIKGCMPNHTSHVLHIFRRTGHHAIPHTLTTMDHCRISWGKVIEAGSQCIVETRPLAYQNNKLVLSSPQNKVVSNIAVPLKRGDWVSIHWGFVCDVLTEIRRKHLVWYTKQALSIANS